MEVDFRRTTLRRAPEVIQRCTRSLWVDTEHRASKDAVKGHHKRGLCVDVLFWLHVLFWFACMIIV